MTRTNIGQASPISVFIQSASISLAASHNATHRRKTICAKNSPVQDLFLIQCLTVFGFGGETETETESQPPKPKPILKTFATETENRNRNRKLATETETDSKNFCHRNRNRFLPPKPTHRNRKLVRHCNFLFMNEFVMHVRDDNDLQGLFEVTAFHFSFSIFIS